ncbi:DUF3857 domain-containing protein [Aequorivita sp. Q41]|uniref:DUF3857 domain-containing protein n=1 Tax=Aequorivita sp. Q41 TaxID=3153300 RepID=UPI003241FA92
MFLRNLLPTTLLFFAFSSIAQVSNIQSFGEPTSEELEMNEFPADPEASGVILYKRGNYTVEAINGQLQLIKEIHIKTKVLDAKKFKNNTVAISYYHEKNFKEQVTNLKAVIHNGSKKEHVQQDAIFDVDESLNWSQKKFTFPNIQNGSILEYTYRIETPYFFSLGSWEFQSELPVLYSELHTELPGNFSYNRILTGDFPLAVNHAELKKTCFVLNGFDKPGDCESATYVMKNLPAFKEEKYMLSKENYIAKIKYEVIQIVDLQGLKKTYTNTWEDVDSKFKKDKDLGRQLKYANYFKEQLPTELFLITDDLERAKAIYYYFQKTMFWNNKSRILSDIRVKDAFENKTGNSSEINLGLINALESAGLDAKIMLIATRDQPLPTTKYPVLTDFNYAMVYLKIKTETYLLDATDKFSPFGMVPFRNLNFFGRVLDFKKESYWTSIDPPIKNQHYANIQLKAEENGVFSGEINEISTGYIAVDKRKGYYNLNNVEIIKKKQSENKTIDIKTFENENDKDLEQPYKENYTVTMQEQTVGDKLYLYPFILKTYFSENPFINETRRYPVALGFPFANNYIISLDVSDKYEIISIPQSRMLKIPDEAGEISVVYNTSENKVNIRLSVKLNNPNFAPEAYKALQEFFTELVKIQSEEPIELKKI